MLAMAETAYTGDFLEDALYEDWAVSLREEARVVYLVVARTLARSAAAGGEHDLAVRHHPQGAGARRLRRGGPPGLVATLAAAGRRARRAVATGSTAKRWTSLGSSQRHSRRRAAQRSRWTAALQGT